jgi:acetyl-CoA carboxylase biotin carboxyl carrier protein
MIDLAFVESLIRALDDSSLDNLELERGETRLRLSKSPPPSSTNTSSQAAPQGISMAPAAPPSHEVPVRAPIAETSTEPVPGRAEEEEGHERLIEVVSPMVGTFYAAPAPDAAPYVEVGQRVGQGTVLCIIEAMKLMNELESEVEGTVAKVMVENAQPVEYGQVLFLIDPF